MSAKKPATEKTIQLSQAAESLGPVLGSPETAITETQILQEKYDALKEENDHLISANALLTESVTSLGAENDHMLEKLANEPLLTSVSTARDIKTEMLFLLLPQVRLDYPRPDAQKALDSVDVIMKTWGLSDG